MMAYTEFVDPKDAERMMAESLRTPPVHGGSGSSWIAAR